MYVIAGEARRNETNMKTKILVGGLRWILKGLDSPGKGK
jgi:hypothetical protein